MRFFQFFVVMRFFYFCIGAAWLATACSKTPDQAGTFFPAPDNPPVDIRYASVRMDTLRIDSLATSFNGLTAVGRRGVYFLDELFCWLYRLDAAGKPQTRLLGQGRSNRKSRSSGSTATPFRRTESIVWSAARTIFTFSIQPDTGCVF